MDTQIISLANQKGGIGKTTTCANLGIGLAREGKRVLLVDCDPQASLTLSLGWRKPETLPVTLVQEGETYDQDHQKLLYPVFP